MRVNCPLCDWTVKNGMAKAIDLFTRHLIADHGMTRQPFACQGCGLDFLNRRDIRKFYHKHYRQYLKDPSHWIEAATRAAFAPKPAIRIDYWMTF
jgi:hypothetical protein